jgi:cobalt-zinc-cadmium efflux system outer membrane protein
MIARHNNSGFVARLKINCRQFLLSALFFGAPSCTYAASEQAQPPSFAPTTQSSSATVTGYGVSRKLTLQECFDKADAENKEILVAATKLSVAQSAIVIAKAIPNPLYNMTYGWGPSWDYVVGGNNQQVGISEEIQVAGRRTKKVGVAASSYLQTALQVEAARFDIHNRVRRAYATLAASTSFERLIKSQRDIAVKLLEISKNKIEKNSDGSKVLQAKLIVMQFETQHNVAKGKVVQDSAQLAQLLGETPRREEIISIEDNDVFNLQSEKNKIVPELARGLPPLEKLLPAAWMLRNDLKAAVQQAYSNRKALTLAKTQRIPDPVIGANYLFTAYNAQQPQDFNPTGSGIIGDPGNRVPPQPAFLLTLSEETPLFYQYQGQVDQAKSTWEHQLKQNDAQKSQIANDIVVAYENLLVARKNIEKFQAELLPESLNVAKLSRQGYQSGTTELATAILAQQQYQQLRAAYFSAVVAYQNAWADLEKAVGVPLIL